MSAKLPWFKVYDEMLTDQKLITFSQAQFGAWAALLCLANRSEERGIVTGDDEDIAAILRFSCVGDWQHFKGKLVQKGLIEVIDPFTILIANWEKRQSRDDRPPSQQPEASRERQRKSRASKKEAMSQPVTTQSQPSHNQIRRDLDLEKIRKENTHTPLTPLQAAQRGSEQPEASVCVTASAGEEPKQPESQTAQEFHQHLSAAYPKSLNPFTDYAEFAKARQEASLEQILAAIAKQKPVWATKDERYIPDFRNWIRGKPWATLPKAKPPSQKPSVDDKAEFERLKQELRGVKNA